jgi:Anti-sigma factor NepR
MNTGKLGNLAPDVQNNKPDGDLGTTMNERKPFGQQAPMEITATKSKKPTGKPAKLGREVQARLGQQLRAMYDEVVNQGVPERFTELLDHLDRNGNKDKT